MSTRRRKKSPRYQDGVLFTSSQYQLPSVAVLTKDHGSPYCSHDYVPFHLSNNCDKKSERNQVHYRKHKFPFFTIFCLSCLFVTMTVIIIRVFAHLHNWRNHRLTSSSLTGDIKVGNIDHDISIQYGNFSIKSRVFHYSTEVERYPTMIISEMNHQSKEIHTTTYKIMDSMLHVNKEEESIIQPELENQSDNRCVPMHEWQTKRFPTCNSIHELDLKQLSNIGFRNRTNIYDAQRDTFDIIGNGWFRNTWKITFGHSLETVVLKTLRYDRDYLHEYFELHRRESVAMERLTSSQYVINIYAFCGQSTINEYADFIHGFQDFKTFAKRIRGNNDRKVLFLKLQIATMITLGVQHIHEIDGRNNASLVHYDLNPMNIVMTAGGIPKINDFNVAEFIYWDPIASRRCGFEGRFKEPWWRSPEEMMWANTKKEYTNITRVPLLDEKVDVYSLGNILFILITGHTPRGSTRRERMSQVKMQVQQGILPSFDRSFLNSGGDGNLMRAMTKAIKKCYEPNPKYRSSARDIAKILLNAIHLVEG